MNTDRWTTPIDAITADFQMQFASLTGEQLNWKPNPSVWSIAQNIDHLMVINGTYFPVIESIRKGSYTLHWFARFSFMVNFFGNVVLDSVQTDRKRRTKTFPIWQPSHSPLPDNILGLFLAEQEKLKQLIISSTDLVELQTIIASPANRKVVYYLPVAFDIIVAHERRHFDQACQVLKMLPNP